MMLTINEAGIYGCNMFELKVSFKTYHVDSVEVGVSFISRNLVRVV